MSPAAGRETLDAGDPHGRDACCSAAGSPTVCPSSALGAEGRTAVAGLIADGLVDGRAALAGRVVLTLRGRLLADAVVRRLHGRSPRALMNWMVSG